MSYSRPQDTYMHSNNSQYDTSRAAAGYSDQPSQNAGAMYGQQNQSGYYYDSPGYGTPNKEAGYTYGNAPAGQAPAWQQGDQNAGEAKSRWRETWARD